MAEANERADQIRRQQHQQPPPPTGAAKSSNDSDHFNYSYYQISYTPGQEGGGAPPGQEGGGAPPVPPQQQVSLRSNNRVRASSEGERRSRDNSLDRLLNQNANDNDDMSYDSYHLSEDYAERSDNDLIDELQDDSAHVIVEPRACRTEKQILLDNSSSRDDSFNISLDTSLGQSQDLESSMEGVYNTGHDVSTDNEIKEVIAERMNLLETDLDEVVENRSYIEKIATEHSQRIIDEAVLL